MKNLQFKVTGMHCESCKAIIEDVARDFPEIKRCEVDFATGNGTIEFTDGFDPYSFKKEIDSLAKYSLEFNL